MALLIASTAIINNSAVKASIIVSRIEFSTTLQYAIFVTSINYLYISVLFGSDANTPPPPPLRAENWNLRPSVPNNTPLAFRYIYIYIIGIKDQLRLISKYTWKILKNKTKRIIQRNRAHPLENDAPFRKSCALAGVSSSVEHAIFFFSAPMAQGRGLNSALDLIYGLQVIHTLSGTRTLLSKYC